MYRWLCKREKKYYFAQSPRPIRYVLCTKLVIFVRGKPILDLILLAVKKSLKSLLYWLITGSGIICALGFSVINMAPVRQC